MQHQLAFEAFTSAGANLPTVIEAHKPEPACRTEPTQRVRARRTDPATSHQAANAAAEFAASHAGHIHLALIRLGNATGKELAHATGYSNEQVCRRAVELQRLGLIEVVVDGQGKSLTRNGSRVWRAVA